MGKMQGGETNARIPGEAGNALKGIDAGHDAKSRQCVAVPAACGRKKAAGRQRESVHLLSYISVGLIQSSFKECRGTPRQGALMPSSKARLVLHRDVPPEILSGLAGYSHVFLIFHFHKNRPIQDKRRKQNRPKVGAAYSRPPFRAKISPPKKTTKGKVGVFATRSPHRPNAVGLTVARLLEVNASAGTLELTGVDLVDGTPIVDIKPYVPHYDAQGHGTTPEWVKRSLSAPALDVIVDPPVEKFMLDVAERGDVLRMYPDAGSLRQSLVEMLQLDIYASVPAKLHWIEIIQQDTVREMRQSRWAGLSCKCWPFQGRVQVVGVRLASASVSLNLIFFIFLYFFFSEFEFEHPEKARNEGSKRSDEATERRSDEKRVSACGKAFSWRGGAIVG